MKTRSSLSKRIKRHVTGRERDFFAVTAPGLEKLCFDELTSLPLSPKHAITVPGGVEFKGSVLDCYLANLRLRTAGRILMRVCMFKASNFGQLEKKMADFPWELFLRPDVSPDISVSSRKSRLYHSEAISGRFLTNISDRLAGFSSDMYPSQETGNVSRGQQIFVRVSDDRFTVSIDSSGENLYKRGIKKQGGTAPLRETIAAAALKLAGYVPGEMLPEEILIDPMCGTGTFSLEGALMAANIPPGYLRNFAFMEWPCFRPRQWNYLRRESEKYFRVPDKPSIFASDKDKAACDALEKVVSKSHLADIIQVSCQDFFDFSPSKRNRTGTPGLVMLNPPYGHRIGTQGESRKLFHDISGKLEKDYMNWKIALITSDRHLVRKLPFKLKSYRFSHGGLKLTLLVGRIT